MTPAAPIPATPVLPAEIDKTTQGWANRPGVSPSPRSSALHANFLTLCSRSPISPWATMVPARSPESCWLPTEAAWPWVWSTANFSEDKMRSKNLSNRQVKG